MLKHILPLIPSHKIYTEAFCGGAAVLFAKRPSEAEIINDINMELTNFYWCMQVYYSDLKHEINKTLHSRDLHAHAGHINSYPQFFTPVERAWAVWVCTKLGFASMAVVTPEETAYVRTAYREVKVSEEVKHYLMDIVEATRTQSGFVSGSNE